jgi:ketosteroid isomerase-like protein
MTLAAAPRRCSRLRIMRLAYPDSAAVSPNRKLDRKREMVETQVTTELMRAISAAFNSRDVDRIVDFFAEDAVFWLARGPEPVGRTLKGKAAIRKALSDRFRQIPDMRWEGQDYILAGDHAVSIWTVRGKGADGEALNYQGCDLYRFKGGKIVEKNTFWKIVEQKDRL